MKKIILLTGALTASLAPCVSQVLEGVITYEAKTNMHRRLPPDRQDMKSMMPEFRTSKEQLFFNANESLYKPIIEDDPDEIANGGGVRIQIARPYFEYYLNATNNEVTSKREFMGKNYLIATPLKIAPWKFSDETKMILGYSCRQAFYTTEDSKQTITAWYTIDIRPFIGPNTYNTLPGAILALDINNEEQVYVATQIELRMLKKNEMRIPKGGQEITDEEFREMMEESMRQMGGNGMRMIRN